MNELAERMDLSSATVSVHLKKLFQPGLDQPLAKLAAFVRNFKRWAKTGGFARFGSHGVSRRATTPRSWRG